MTTKQTDGERLVKVETKLESVEKVVLKMDAKLDDILKEQNNIRLQNVTRAELETEIRRLEESGITNSQKIEAAIAETKKRHTVTVWVSSILAIIFSSLVTLLLAYFIQNIGR